MGRFWGVVDLIGNICRLMFASPITTSLPRPSISLTMSNSLRHAFPAKRACQKLEHCVLKNGGLIASGVGLWREGDREAAGRKIKDGERMKVRRNITVHTSNKPWTGICPS